MMNKKKKYFTDDKLEIVQEFSSLYNKEEKLSSESSEELHPILIQLIEKGKRESALGLGISQEEAMRSVKLKYPFLK